MSKQDEALRARGFATPAELGAKRFKVWGTDAHTGARMALPARLRSVVAPNAASARRKIFHQVGGHTIGWKIHVQEVPPAKPRGEATKKGSGLGRGFIGTPTTPFDTAVYRALGQLLAGDCDRAQEHAGQAQLKARGKQQLQRATRLVKVIDRCQRLRG